MLWVLTHSILLKIAIAATAKIKAILTSATHGGAVGYIQTRERRALKGNGIGAKKCEGWEK
jgi:hypothetical protein